MTKSILRLSLLGLLAAGITGTSVHLRAQDTNNAAGEKQQPKLKKLGVTPFHGNLKSVDSTAKTISVGALTVQITSETKIDKAGQPAMLQDGVVGEVVSGAYKKTEDGKLDATTVHFGPKEAKKRAKKDDTASDK